MCEKCTPFAPFLEGVQNIRSSLIRTVVKCHVDVGPILHLRPREVMIYRDQDETGLKINIPIRNTVKGRDLKKEQLVAVVFIFSMPLSR